MDQVKVKKDELLKILKSNLDTHHGIFLEAQEGYRRMVIEELDKMLQEAREGKTIRRTVQLVEPQDHTKDYTTAIRMIEMSVDEAISISDFDFKRYVLDEWDWSSSFSSSSSSYCSTSSKSSGCPVS